MKVEDAHEIKFDRCHRLGGQKPQPVIVRFCWFKDRMRVFHSKSKLSNSDISLREDFPVEISNQRKILYPFMKIARKRGHFAELRADKLLIDNVPYTVHTLDKLPEGCDPALDAIKHYDTVTAFFGGASPLSNFFSCSISIDNVTYSSVEQYYQHQKCVFAENVESARRVKAATTPLACKRLGDAVKVNNDQWMPVAMQEMHRAILAKFTQNARARAFLMQTKDSVLAEATLDKVWGTGLKLSDVNLGKQAKWNGKNRTGEILMRVRHELSNVDA
jgi:ribA/ribD-fused uncharacterized protein